MLQEESGLQARWQENLTNFMNKRMLRPVVKPAQGTAMGAGSVEATMIKKMIAAVPAATETAATSEAALMIIAIQEDFANNNNKVMASQIQAATEEALKVLNSATCPDWYKKHCKRFNVTQQQ